MNKRFLAYLAQRLEKIAATPPKKRKRTFDMRCWYEPRFDCGTTACAMGEACFIPVLQRAGLRLKDHGFGLIPTIYRPDGSKAYGSEAAVELFGITPAVAQRLFLPKAERSASPAQVARRIRKVIANGSTK